jgi:hypothetical protein
MFPKHDPAFHRILPAFTKELENLLRQRAEELSARIADEITSKARLGKITDTIFPRYALYREHARTIGEDFLAAFREIVKPHCEVISDESRPILYTLLHDRYRNTISETENALKRLAQSLGHKESDFESIISPARGTYSDCLSKYNDLLEAEILKHNLGVDEKAEDHATQRVKGKKKSKSEMKAIYNGLVVFHGNKRREYEKLNGTDYGAAKYADEATAKEIWKLHRVKVSPRNVRDAMSRN